MKHVLQLYYSKYISLEVLSPEAECINLPIWAYILRHISSLMMALDASLGFVIYCIACEQFRKELNTLFQNICKKIKNMCVQEVNV
jgi:hypothetical protein